MRALLLLLVLACIPAEDPVYDSFQCPGDDTRYYMTQQVDCGEPVVVWSACEDPPAEDPDDFAPIPPVDPDYDEHGPGPVDDGAPGAPTVDHPDVPAP
jgi:hypothetical protein